MKVPVEMTLTYWSGGGTRTPVLAIRDRESRQLLCEVKLTPTELVDFMSTAQVTPEAPADVTDHPHRLGMRAVTEVVYGLELGDEPSRFEHTGSGKSRPVLPEPVRARMDQLLAEGWETAQPSHTRSGWQITVRRWEPVGEENLDADLYGSSPAALRPGGELA